MNKKVVLTTVASALVAFVGFGFYKASELTSIQIVKTVVIKNSNEEVFNAVKYLKNYPKWSPFLAQDPGQKYEIKGEDGTVGAQYHWKGSGGDDFGYQEIDKIENLSFVGMKCDIQAPFVAKPTFEYSFKETPGGIEVSQDFKLKSGLVDAFFMWLFGVKAEMEKTNQQGLDLLKKSLEQA
jgi:hypothetical protein